MKIAIAVHEDQDTIFKRTGQAPIFAIYKDNNFIKTVKNGHSHSEDEHDSLEHHEHINGHLKDIQDLKGIEVILVQAIGPHMREALEMLNIKIVKIDKSYGNSAKEAISKFLKENS